MIQLGVFNPCLAFRKDQPSDLLIELLHIGMLRDHGDRKPMFQLFSVKRSRFETNKENGKSCFSNFHAEIQTLLGLTNSTTLSPWFWERLFESAVIGCWWKPKRKFNAISGPFMKRKLAKKAPHLKVFKKILGKQNTCLICACPTRQNYSMRYFVAINSMSFWP